MKIQPSPSVPTSRRRRRIVRDVAGAVIAVFAFASCSSGASDRPVAAESREPTSASPSASAEATVSVGPGAGTGFFGGSAGEVPVRYTMPAGWHAEDVFVVRSGADPAFGLAFFDVANIYADGCQWKLVDPPVGPSVDELVSAYQKLPALKATPAREVSVDGHKGKQISITMPNYDANKCTERKFGIFQMDSGGTNTGLDDAPALWAQTPRQENQLLILNVNGTRLVILALYPPNISTQDRTDEDAILNSIQIG